MVTAAENELFCYLQNVFIWLISTEAKSVKNYQVFMYPSTCSYCCLSSVSLLFFLVTPTTTYDDNIYVCRLYVYGG